MPVAMTRQPTADDLYRVVKSQLGYVERGGPDGHSGNITQYGAKYGMNGVSWCSIFVWWCFMQLGINLKEVISNAYASAQAALDGWKRKGWEVNSKPRFMDVGFMHFQNEHAGANHTVFIIEEDAKGYHTIEGNTSSGDHGSQANGGGVYARYRAKSLFIGFGRYPLFAKIPKALPKSKPIQGKAYPTLHYGMGAHTVNGDDVKRLQYLLHIPVTGNFDRVTETHVKQAQFNRHLLQDGIAGPATLRALGF